MKLAGDYTLQAHVSVDRLWDALNDPNVLQKCTPGCEQIIDIGGEEYELLLELGIAAVKGRYKGKMKIQDKVPPSHYVLVVEGSGAAGFVNGRGVIDVKDQDDRVVIRYEGEVKVGGAIAAIGQRMLGGVAKMIVGQFFKALDHQLIS